MIKVSGRYGWYCAFSDKNGLTGYGTTEKEALQRLRIAIREANKVRKKSN